MNIQGQRKYMIQIMVMLIVQLICTVSALPFEGPKETSTTVTQSSTDHPPKPTPMPILSSIFHFKRQRNYFSDNVCGFVSGSLDSPVTCNTDSSCIWDTSHNVVGCMPRTTGTIMVHTDCVDASQFDSAQLAPSEWSNGVLVCLPGTTNNRCYTNTYPRLSGTVFHQLGCGSTDDAAFIATSASHAEGYYVKIVETAISLGDGPEGLGQILTTSSLDTTPSSTHISTSKTMTKNIVATPIPVMTSVKISTTTGWTKATISSAVSSSNSSDTQHTYTPTIPTVSPMTPDKPKDNSNSQLPWLGAIPLIPVFLGIVYYTIRHFRKKMTLKAASSFEVLSGPIIPTAYEMEATPAARSGNAIYEMCAVVSDVYQHRRTISELEDSSPFAGHKTKRKRSDELRITVLHAQHESGRSSSPAELASERSPRFRSIYELPS